MSNNTRGHHAHGPSVNSESRHISSQMPAAAGKTDSPAERARLIEIRAYELWEQAGKPGGEVAKEHFWCEAEKCCAVNP